jgi:hypothetical protein
MKKWIALIALGASMLAVLATDAEAAEAASHRYCGTAADGFPGVIAVGPTTCGFARNVATTFDRKRVPLYQWRPHIWMPRPTWIAPGRRRCTGRTGCTAARG